jgi:hypothetical protein
MTLIAEPAKTEPKRRPRWRRRLLVASVLVLLAVVFHASLFRLLAAGLVVDEPLTKTDAIVFDGRNGPVMQIPLDEVAELYRDGLAGRVILIEDSSSRIVQQRILPTLDTVVKRELPRRGVPAQAITTLSVEVRGERDMPERLQRWLSENPESTVTVLVRELNSRDKIHTLRHVLKPEESSRVHIHAVPDPRYNATNWWNTRRGVTELATCYIALAHTLLIDEGEPPARWDPDEFERSLRATP